MSRQQVTPMVNVKLSVLLLDSTDHVTEETGITYEQATAKYWVTGSTSKQTYTLTAANWKEAGNGDYALIIGSAEFMMWGHDYDVCVRAPGCDPCRINLTTSDFRASSHYGNLLATEAGLLTLSNKLAKISTITQVDPDGIEYPSSTPTGCAMVGDLQYLEPGDIILWEQDMAGEPGPYSTVVTSREFDGEGFGLWYVNWTPALSMAPWNEMPVTILRNPQHVYQRAFPLAGAQGGSLQDGVKTTSDKLPSGTISDYDEHRCRANVGYDGSALTVNAWLEHRGELVAAPASCSVSVHDDAGTELFELSSESADAQGVFRLSKSEPGLVAGRSYYALVEITSSGATFRTAEGIATL